MAIRIVTDTNCDLPKELLEAHAIVAVPFYINVGADSYLDNVEMSHAAFYEGLPNFEVQPTTSVPGPGTYLQVYQRLAQEAATEILSIHMAGSLSAMANSARLAAEEFDTIPVTVFDSGNLTLGTGFQVLAAAQAVAEGLPMAEIVAQLEDLAARTYCFAALDTLEFLRRSGRLSSFQWGLGSVLQIKPILKMNAGTAEMERVRTRNGAFERLLALVEGLGPLEKLAVVHTHAPEAKRSALQQQAAHLFPGGKVAMEAEVTPVIGAHIGPQALGFIAVQAPTR
ncbi:MAG: DegV family protein [Anaerolineae bacterium]|nr:DegV family protein [Anaerolineae bacterium]